MSKTILVRCPQGIEALCAYGERVARDGAWTRENTLTALVGLWISCQVARAELRGTVEIHDNRVQVTNESTPASEEARIIDAALNAVWVRYRAEAMALGATEPDQAVIDVTVPGEVGALPAVVTIAAIVAGAGAISWIVTNLGTRWMDHVEASDQREYVERESLRANAKAAMYQRDWMEADKARIARGDPNPAPLSPVAAADLKATAERQMVMANNVTKPTPPAKGWFEGLEDLALPLTAVAAIGGLLLLRGRS